MEDAVVIGFIRKPLGLSGEVRVEDLTAGVFEPAAGQAVTLRRGDAAERSVIETWRADPKGVVAKFAGRSDRTAAEHIQGWEISVARAELPPRPPGVYYDFELVGLPVETTAGEAAGEVVGLYGARGSDILVIREGERVYELPFVRAHVAAVEIGGKIIILPHREE